MATVRASWSTTGTAQPQESVSTQHRSDHVIATGDLVINTQSHEVMRDGELIEVTKTEFDLLVILATHPRRVFTARQLFHGVWTSHYFDADHVIETHISRLRRKLGESGTHPRYIHTVRGVGYRFEPQPDTAEGSEPRPGSYRVRLAPDLTVAGVDPGLAEVLGAAGDDCTGHPVTDLLSGLATSAHLSFTTRPVRDDAGSIVGIDLEIRPHRAARAFGG